MAEGARTPESHIWERRGTREEGEGMQRKVDLELGSSQGPGLQHQSFSELQRMSWGGGEVGPESQWARQLTMKVQAGLKANVPQA